MEFRFRAGQRRRQPQSLSPHPLPPPRPMQGYVGLNRINQRPSQGFERELYRPQSPISSPTFFADEPTQGYIELKPMPNRSSLQTVREEILPQSHHLPCPISSSTCFTHEPKQADYISLNTMHEMLARRKAQKRMVKGQIRRRAIGMDREMMTSERLNAPSMMKPPEEFTPHVMGGELEFDRHPPFRVIIPSERRPSLIMPPEHRFVPPLMGSQADLDRQLPPLMGISSNVEKLQEKSSVGKFSGRKRMAKATSSRAKDYYGCALCKTSMTCERDFDGHIKGKKHVSKAADQLGKLSASSSSSMPKKVSASRAKGRKKKNKKMNQSGGTKVIISIDGKMHEVIGEGSFLWCAACSAKCNSKDMMVAHLKGKRHLVKELQNGEE